MNKIKPKRSYTTNSVPTANDLEANELAINWADGKAYTKNASGQIVSVTLGGSGGSGLSWSSVPASATATGTAGQIAYDGNFFYIATATNTWRRAAVSTWSSDPYFSSVVLLMHGDGNLTDSSSTGSTFTAYGNAAATGSAKFGSASIAFDGNGDYLTAPYSSAFDFPGDFAMEVWVYFNAYSASYFGAYGAGILSRYSADGSPANSGWHFGINGAASAYNSIYLSTGVDDMTWSYTFALSTWYHVAVARSGSSIRAYVDGSQVGSTVTNSDNMTRSSSSVLNVGRLAYSGYERYLNGRLDDIRITKGSARGYTGASITVPTAAFPDE